MARRVISLVLLMAASLLFSGCLSRKLAVMDLHDTLNAIADEMCGLPIKGRPAEQFTTVELVTATGFTGGIDASGLGIPIAVSGNVSDSTTIKVDLSPRGCPDKSMRLAKRQERAVYEYDTRTGTLTPLNNEAKARLKK